MADLTRAEELVQAIERDDAFRAEVEAAPTIPAKRQLIVDRGFGDVTLEDMRALIESKGGTLTFQESGHELSDEELAAVAGGLSDAENIGIAVGLAVGGTAIGGAFVAAAFVA